MSFHHKLIQRIVFPSFYPPPHPFSLSFLPFSEGILKRLYTNWWLKKCLGMEILNAGGRGNSSYPDLFIIHQLFVWNCHNRFHKYVKYYVLVWNIKRESPASYEGWSCKWGQVAGFRFTPNGDIHEGLSARAAVCGLPRREGCAALTFCACGLPASSDLGLLMNQPGLG